MTGARPPVTQFEYVDSMARFLELEEEWNDLDSRSDCHIFQNHRFIRSWLETAASHIRVRLAIVLYRENDVLQAIFPGCVIKRMGLPNLTWLGGFHLVDYGDVIFDSSAVAPLDEFIDQAFSLLKQRLGVHACFLDNVREDAVVHDYLIHHFRSYRHGVAPYISLDGSFAEYFDSLKTFRKKMRSDTQRQIRRLSALGALEFRICRDDDDRERVVRTFIEQKKARLQELDRAGAIDLPGYSDLIRMETNHNRHSHVSCLALDDEIIAVHYGYMHPKKRFYYYMPSFAGKYGAYSPGRVLIYYLLEECFAQGVKVFDFTVGSEPYKYDWTRDEVTMTSFMGNAPTTRAVRYLLPFRDPRSLTARMRARFSQE